MRAGGEMELSAAIEQLRSVATPAQRDAVEHLLARVHSRRLRVLVAGEAKRGKSTLVNGLLARDVLPYGLLPVTAIATTVRVDTSTGEHLDVHYLDGRVEIRPITDLAGLITEHANPGNRLGVAGVDVLLSDAALAGYRVELVDTPGTGSIFEHNTRAARGTYDSLDAVVVVLTADPPITAADRQLLLDLSRSAIKTFVVLNKADRVAADELAEVLHFTCSVCAAAGLTEQVWPMSARDRDAGFARFQQAFEHYLAARAELDAGRAIAAHAIRLGSRMRDEALVAVRAAELATAAGQDQVERFRETIDALTRQTVELADLSGSAKTRLLRDLGESADSLIADLSTQALRQAQLAFDALERTSRVEEAEAGSRRAAVDEIVTGVDQWRSAQADMLQRELGELTERINRDVRRQLADLRATARKLLGVELTGAADPVVLEAGRGFWYATERAPAWELPGAELARRHGPRAMRRARNRTLGEVHELTDRQIGRARADLQQRLNETVLRLTAQLRRNHGDLLDQLRAAVDTASQLASDDAAEATQQRGILTARVRVLDEIVAGLAEADEHLPLDVQARRPD